MKFIIVKNNGGQEKLNIHAVRHFRGQNIHGKNWRQNVSARNFEDLNLLLTINPTQE
jgi:hypothetical protein